jgi:hypothetical protein
MSSPYLQYLPEYVRVRDIAEHVDALFSRQQGPLDPEHFMTLRRISMVAAPHWRVLSDSRCDVTLYAPLTESTCAVALFSGMSAANPETAARPISFYRSFDLIDSNGWPISSGTMEKISEQEFMKYIAASLDTLRVAAVKEAL